MKRFLPTLALLTVGLLLLTSGVNATLNCLDRAPSENSFVWYNEKGVAIMTFTGFSALVQKFPHPARPTTSSLFHRTSNAVASTDAVPSLRYF